MVENILVILYQLQRKFYIRSSLFLNWHLYIIHQTSWAFERLKRFYQMFLWLLYLILLSIKQCLRNLFYIVCLMNTTKNMGKENMGSTELHTSMFQKKHQRF